MRCQCKPELFRDRDYVIFSTSREPRFALERTGSNSDALSGVCTRIGGPKS